MSLVVVRSPCLERRQRLKVTFLKGILDLTSIKATSRLCWVGKRLLYLFYFYLQYLL